MLKVAIVLPPFGNALCLRRHMGTLCAIIVSAGWN